MTWMSMEQQTSFTASASVRLYCVISSGCRLWCVQSRCLKFGTCGWTVWPPICLHERFKNLWCSRNYLTTMYVCMYVCMYACMYICFFTHSYIHTYMHRYIPTYLHICVFIYEYICMNALNCLFFARFLSNCNEMLTYHSFNVTVLVSVVTIWLVYGVD
jgi:hypothetical protein